MTEIGEGVFSYNFNQPLPESYLEKFTEVESIIKEDEMGEKLVYGIKIQIKNKTAEEASRLSKQKADSIANLLTVKSGIPVEIHYVRHNFQEYNSKKSQAGACLNVGLRIVNNFTINQDEVERLNDVEYANDISQMSIAIKSLDRNDWSGTIINLNVIMEERYEKYPHLKKYKYLRHILAHDKLDDWVIEKIQKEFGKEYFIFINKTFDKTSEANKRNLHEHAVNFMTEVRNILSP